MELNKKNVRIILLIIVFTVVLFTAVQNIGAILGFAVDVWGVFSSVIAGLAIAFVLNVPLRIFENKWFYGLREHRNPTVRKMLRPVSIVCSLLITLGVLIVLLLIVLPQLVEAVAAVLRHRPYRLARQAARALRLFLEQLPHRYRLDKGVQRHRHHALPGAE